jgi:undecaprenyl-diphosphatase
MFFDPEITNVLRDALPWAESFFRIITEFGAETIFVVLIFAGYWTYKKKESMQVGLLLVASVLTNYWLKVAIANPRPPLSYRLPEVDAPNYSTPSGHSQNSTAVYGGIAIKARRWWLTLAAALLSILVGVSRVYLGVHYLEDIILGWGVGIVILLAYIYAWSSVEQFLSKYREEAPYVVLILVGFVGLVICAYLLPQPPDDNFGLTAGLTMGLPLGLLLEKKFVNFSVEPHDGQKWRLVVRVVVGLVLMLGAMLGLRSFLPSEDIWLRTARYGFVVLIGTFIWPFIFKKLNL